MKLTEPNSLTEMKIFLTELAAFSDEERAEIFSKVYLSEAAYRVPPEQRTDEETALVQEHEDWKNPNPSEPKLVQIRELAEAAQAQAAEQRTVFDLQKEAEGFLKAIKDGQERGE
jgi:hypothetical protein